MTSNLRKRSRNVVLSVLLVFGVSGLMPVTASAATLNSQTAVFEDEFECFGNTYFNLRGTRHELIIRDENFKLAALQVNYRGTATKDGQTYRYSERLVIRFVGDQDPVFGEKVQAQTQWDVTMKGPGLDQSATWHWFYSFSADFSEFVDRKYRSTFDPDSMCGFGY